MLFVSNKMKIIGIIPARGGSKRIPGKNKKKLAGKELVRYAIEAALNSNLLTTVVLSSDDKDILKIGREYDNIKVINRPEEISGDEAPAITYVNHVLECLQESFDIVVIVQPSSPFTLPQDIDGTIQLLMKNVQADSAASIMKLDHAIHPVKLKVKDGDVLHPYLEEEAGRMAAHQLPELFVRNCSVYVSWIACIEKGKIIGDNCLGYEMPRERSLDINDPIDFEFAEFMIKRNELRV